MILPNVRPRLPRSLVLLVFSALSVWGLAGLRISSWPPWKEGILDVAERRSEVWEMPKQDGRHVVVVDPVKTDLRVDLRSVILCEEPVAVQPSRRHEDEDAKGCIAKPEPLRSWFSIQTNHKVDQVDIVFVDAPEIICPAR